MTHVPPDPSPYRAPDDPAPYQPSPYQAAPGSQPQGPHPVEPQYQVPYATTPDPPPGTNGLAIASLVTSFFGLCGGVLGAIFGLVALSQIRRTGQKVKGLAIAGLSISGAWVLLIAVAVVVAILTDADRDSSGNVTREGSVSVNELRTGDCLKSVQESSMLTSVPAVRCSQMHQGEVFGEFDLSGSPYPGETEIDRKAQDECQAKLTSYASEKNLDLVEDLYYLYPRESDWRRGSRTVTCVAVHANRTESLKE